jgi:acetyl-CoA carboxylase biotin carboxylase subunit
LIIRRILIANRGEIAVRVIRTCRQLGIEAILAASEADLDSMPARLADRTLCIGSARPGDSYLNVNAILQAALAAGADAVHPGYGFLSERPALVRACEAHGVIFIGPTVAQIESVGDKLRARIQAQASEVEVVPGGPVGSIADAVALARRIGLPVLVKAVGGGGGKGMKRVERLEDLPHALELAQAEAGAAFGDARVYIERFVTRGRHIEVQILGDGAGGVIHLGERDCSIQRRYQKLIEETPAPGLPEALRHRLHEAAVRFGRRMAYRGAGTVEFLVDLERDAFHFLEMNARIQVEHPVTEAVTGVDLVAEQIAVAAGEGLRLAQSDILARGCALECRVNAEDAMRGFQPCPGRVRAARWPSGEGLRVDTHIEAGARVPPYYDSLMGKIIAHEQDRESALERMWQAIAATRIEGVASNLPLHSTVLADREFQRGGVDTGFLARLLERPSMLVEAKLG